MIASSERDKIQPARPVEDRRRLGVIWWVLLGLVFIVGLCVRLYDLADPPLDFHPTRQVHSALIARGMYYQQNPDVPEWQREMAVMQWRTEGLIEPQVFERVVAWTYRLVGGPDLRIPRLFAILAWMIGAGFLVGLSVDLTGRAGGLLTALFFLVWPYGVIASRSFQPEPLVVALMITCLWSAVRWERRGGWGWTVATGLLAGFSIYIKSVAVFFVGPALVTLVLSGGGLKSLRKPRVWVIGLLAVLPAAIYTIDGVYLRGYLMGQFANRFFPSMWIDPAFYLRWISNLSRAVSFDMLLLAAAGVFLIRRPLYRVVVLAMWVGYLLYGLALPHLISTHDYYHLLLYPAIALGLAGLGEVIFTQLPDHSRLPRLVITMIFLVALVMNAYYARSALKRFDAAVQAKMWTEIGGLLGPGASVAALAPDYGVGMKYWGWINPALWLTTDDIAWRESLGDEVDFQAWFEQQASGKDFFVVTMFDELERQPQLKHLLNERYPLYRQSPGYLIYDLRSP